MQYEYKFNKEDCWFSKTCKDYGNKDVCMQFCERYRCLHFHAKQSLMTEKQQHPPKLVVPEQDKQEYERLIEIRNDIYKYVKNGNNLVIKSERCGNGKTTWMTKLAMQYMAHLRTLLVPKVMWVNCARFCLQMKNMVAGYTHKDLHFLLDHIEDADLVLWDDLAVSDMTNYDYLNLYTYINYRMDAGLSNFYTINMRDEDIVKTLGDRLYSRIMNGSEIITFHSPDFRYQEQFTK